MITIVHLTGEKRKTYLQKAAYLDTGLAHLFKKTVGNMPTTHIIINHTYLYPATPDPVIALITEWKNADGSIQKRNEKSDLGGTMRLGAQSSDVAPGTLAYSIYGPVVTERHRHRYEANVNYLDRLRESGLVISALTQREHLTEIVELPQSVHPWFVGVQFHPEFKSTPWDGHPLFNAFVKAALVHHAAEGGKTAESADTAAASAGKLMKAVS